MYICHRPANDQLTKDYREILNEQFMYYRKLYSSNPEVKFDLINRTDTKLSEHKKVGV